MILFNMKNDDCVLLISGIYRLEDIPTELCVRSFETDDLEKKSN
jgi:hypothetical protein